MIVVQESFNLNTGITIYAHLQFESTQLKDTVVDTLKEKTGHQIHYI